MEEIKNKKLTEFEKMAIRFLEAFQLKHRTKTAKQFIEVLNK